MIIVYQFSRTRVARWLAGLAERSGLSALEVEWKIDAAAKLAHLHDDCLGIRNLLAQELGRGKHRREFARCESCRSFVNLVWLCSATYDELKEVAGNRAHLLFFGLRAVENALLGTPEKKSEHGEATKRSAKEERDAWGAELFSEAPQRRVISPYANVGVYNPDDEDDADTKNAEPPCFTLVELLRFGRLSPQRRYWAKECAECRTMVRNILRLRVVVGTLPDRTALYRIAHERGKAARIR